MSPRLPTSIRDAASAMRGGELSSAELTDAMLARADRLDSRLGAYVDRFDEAARQAARAADTELAAGVDRGPLHGIPIAIKDILATREAPTRANSRASDPSWFRGRDARVVARLRDAGAVITGKTTTMEYAFGIVDPDAPFPVPRNPWDTDLWPGGSSSGAAIGLAAGFFLGAVGTDTGGSIRLPAALCGVSGLKPTHGRVPMEGCLELSRSLDTIGPLARTVEDCGLLLEAMGAPASPAGEPRSSVPEAATPADLAGMRVGIADPATLREVGVDPDIASAYAAAIGELRAHGAEVAAVTLPAVDDTLIAMMFVSGAEAFAYHRTNLRSRADDYSVDTRRRILSGALVSGSDYVRAQGVRQRTQDELARLFETIDVYASPTLLVPGFRYENDRIDFDDVIRLSLTAYWSAVGCPALALPMGFSRSHCPLGLQLAGPAHGERRLLQLGCVYQQLTSWHAAYPSLVGAAA